MKLRFLLALAPAAALLLTAPAKACASCGCGDPTLTSMGAEQPFVGRFRAATLARVWGLSGGTPGIDEQQLREARLDLAAAWSPLRWLTLSAQLPLQRRELLHPNLARETSLGLGEAELAARAVLWRDRTLAPRVLLSALVGSKLATSPRQRTPEGEPLSLDAQLGTGSFDAFGGLSLLGFSGEWSGLINFTGFLTGSGFDGFRAGNSLHSSLFVQRHLTSWLAIRAGADARLEAPSHAPEEGLHGGGLFVQGAPDALFRLSEDGVLQLGVRVPLVNLLQDGLRPSPTLQATYALDL